MIEDDMIDYLRGYVADFDLDNPNWDDAGLVNDWRNHVHVEVKKIWSTFTAEQKVALAIQAQASASTEKWD